MRIGRTRLSDGIRSRPTVAAKAGNFQLATVDLDDDVLHSVMTGGGSGKTKTDDTTTTTFANGASSATRTVTFAQHGKTGAITVSWGDLSDAEGHTGGWDLTSTTSGKVNDTVTITTSQNGTRSWIETGRHFAIDESSKSNSTYHEADDGLNTAAASNDPSIYGTYDHTVDTTTSANQSNKQNGTPTNYTVCVRWTAVFPWTWQCPPFKGHCTIPVKNAVHLTHTAWTQGAVRAGSGTSFA